MSSICNLVEREYERKLYCTHCKAETRHMIFVCYDCQIITCLRCEKTRQTT
ncbi:hypothetical protein LCGC14_2477300 [marine sediment metagenome]|uniref:Uncharacterized protein n=1 Tax=marine sediment metagenome TaxID=412755 RepID=A0A0F9B8M0_9ZZZZ